MKRFFVLLLVAGCGPTITSSSPDSVSVKYDALHQNAGDTAPVAAEACAGYGKRPELVGDVHSVPTAKISENLGERIATWRCI